MADPEKQADPSPSPDDDSSKKKKAKKKKRRRRFFRFTGWGFFLLIVALVAIRASLPRLVTWYVNRTIDQNPLYDGRIGDVDLHLWRGAYSIEDIRLNKTTGNVPVPLFHAKRLVLAVEWGSLLEGKVVGRIEIREPELNFVDADDESQDQTGAGGPWLKVVQDLFPFNINSAQIHNGTIRFRAFQSDPPVELYMTGLEASIENLTNIRDEVTPLVATVTARAVVMDQAQFEYEMKLNPFTYRPTFQLAVRLIGLDVTKINALTRAYGQFDFERGWFDLVVELDAKEGALEGYVKPLFRNLSVFSAKRDGREDHIIGVFWEALVGVATEILENQRRDQFGTVVAFRGDVDSPKTNVLEIVGNVLRNAFVRAYLPRLQGAAEEIDGLQFSPGKVGDPVSATGP